MKLPSAKYADRLGKTKQLKFGGLNHRPEAGDGEIWDMRNLTSDHTPVLAVRDRRWKVAKLTQPGGIYAWEKLAWVDGTGFYYGGEQKGQVSAGLKRFASLGTNIVILPDKCWYNTETDSFGQIEAAWEGDTLRFGNGTLYGEEAEANALTAEGADWVRLFRPGDAVTISGCETHPENNKTVIIRAIDGDTLYFYEYAFTLEGEEGYSEEGQLTVARRMPDLECLWENENRLWGYDGRTVYASKLGDIFNWNVYDGLETDSWTITPGSAGDFTGCIAYKGYSVFAKEDRIYKVYGSTPSSFSMAGSASLGVAWGSGASMAVAGETLFYLGTGGIMAYGGGIPQPIGEELGDVRFSDAVGGSDGLKYYVSMADEDGDWGLYVYDTRRRLWHKEDDTRVLGFAKVGGELYFLNDRGEIWCCGKPAEMPEGAQPEEDVKWMAEFADFTEEDPNKKGLTKLQLRLELDVGARLAVWLQTDSDGKWQHIRDIAWNQGEGKRSFLLPIVPRRCDHYRIRIEGTGGCRIHSMAREFYAGSEAKSKPGRN